jgi:gas vesicle protein
MESGKTALGLILGLGVGALIGVLFAPDQGSRTRRKILDKGHDLTDELKGKFEGLYQEASEKYGDFLAEAKTAITPSSPKL